MVLYLTVMVLPRKTLLCHINATVFIFYGVWSAVECKKEWNLFKGTFLSSLVTCSVTLPIYVPCLMKDMP